MCFELVRCWYTKVCQFQLSFFIDEQILRLEVSMKDLPSVTVCQTSQKLEQEYLEKIRNRLVFNSLTVENVIKSNITFFFHYSKIQVNIWHHIEWFMSIVKLLNMQMCLIM